VGLEVSLDSEDRVVEKGGVVNVDVVGGDCIEHKRVAHFSFVGVNDEAG
jgi:hypothetical protein